VAPSAQSVVITGTSTGIGRAAVERMAADGWVVYAGVRKDADADALRATIAGDVRPVMLDVTSADQLSTLVQQLNEELGPRGLDGLVNNAGVADGGPIEGLSDQDWRQHFDVNFFGVVNVTREFLPLLRLAKGRVVNVASVGGRIAAPMMGPYSAAKHAIEAFSESLRFEVEGFGIGVACVEPGGVKTPIWDKAGEQLDGMKEKFSADILQRYSRHLDMMFGFVADGAKNGVEPSKVADAIFDALTSNRPKHRYLVGPDAKMVGVISRLPDRMRHGVFGLNASRMARSGRKLRG
jgi:NAD(P)-dependent dehydrogenase (short-subunit alcohol dehydrogenase family)